MLEISNNNTHRKIYKYLKMKQHTLNAQGSKRKLQENLENTFS